MPWLADRVDEITSFDDVKLLDVQLNRLRRWYTDGLLLIGDAAHAMSPVGGVGINLAVADAVAAASMLAGPLRAGHCRHQAAGAGAGAAVVADGADSVGPARHPRPRHRCRRSTRSDQPAKPPLLVRIVTGCRRWAPIAGYARRDRPAARARAGVCPPVDVRRSAPLSRRKTSASMMSDDAANGSERRACRGRHTRHRLSVTEPGAVRTCRARRLRNPFPPIADYAFLSDCENTCLISSSGSVEWLCVPRPDSPSVFGAILDRGRRPLPVEPVRGVGAGGAPLPAGQPDPGDHLADPHRLDDRARRAGDGPVARHRHPVAHPPPHPDGLGRRAHPAAHRALRERHRRAGDELRAVVRLPPRSAPPGSTRPGLRRGDRPRQARTPIRIRS